MFVYLVATPRRERRRRVAWSEYNTRLELEVDPCIEIFDRK